MDNQASNEEQVVVFRLESELYGVNIFHINEIIRLREITPIPHTASHIRGLVNLRGKTIPVVDLHSRFGLSDATNDDSCRIVVVESEGGNIGMIVDEVHEVVTLTAEAVAATPSYIASIDADFIRGLASRSERLIALLDLDRVLAA